MINVIFVRNDGTATIEHQKTVPLGGLATSITPAPRANHTFGGWFLEPGTVTPKNFSNPVNPANGEFLRLYARWIPQGVVTTPPGGGGGGGTTVTPPDREPDATPGDERLVRHAYLIGNDLGLVRPRGNITRAEVATIFFRLISDAERETYWMQTNPFTDVALEQWFNNAVSTTTNMGLFQGVSADTFAPQRNITRGEFAAVLVRHFANGEGVDLASFADLSDQFNDIDGHWANSYINIAAENGWVQGSEGLNGPFNPNQAVTRAEAAAMINRIFGRLQRSVDDLLPDMLTWPDNANVDAWYYLYIQSATNSYAFEWHVGGVYENWLERITPRGWTVLERPDSRPGDIGRAAS
jgi:hypothetical protein